MIPQILIDPQIEKEMIRMDIYVVGLRDGDAETISRLIGDFVKKVQETGIKLEFTNGTSYFTP